MGCQALRIPTTWHPGQGSPGCLAKRRIVESPGSTYSLHPESKAIIHTYSFPSDLPSRKPSKKTLNCAYHFLAFPSPSHRGPASFEPSPFRSTADRSSSSFRSVPRPSSSPKRVTSRFASLGRRETSREALAGRAERSTIPSKVDNWWKDRSATDGSPRERRFRPSRGGSDPPRFAPRPCAVQERQGKGFFLVTSGDPRFDIPQGKMKMISDLKKNLRNRPKRLQVSINHLDLVFRTHLVFHTSSGRRRHLTEPVDFPTKATQSCGLHGGCRMRPSLWSLSPFRRCF